MDQAQDEDRRLRRTTVGVHKDDVVFTLGDHAMKRFGSQGQQKNPSSWPCAWRNLRSLKRQQG